MTNGPAVAAMSPLHKSVTASASDKQKVVATSCACNSIFHTCPLARALCGFELLSYSLKEMKMLPGRPV